VTFGRSRRRASPRAGTRARHPQLARHRLEPVAHPVAREQIVLARERERLVERRATHADRVRRDDRRPALNVRIAVLKPADDS